MIYIYSGTVVEAQDAAKFLGLDRKNWRWLADDVDLKKAEGQTIVRWGTYCSRPHVLEEMIVALKNSGRIRLLNLYECK